MKKKKDNKSKLVKKVSRETFMYCDTKTKVFKDKTTYSRKIKHKKPLE